jgi:hypothetical protein
MVLLLGGQLVGVEGLRLDDLVPVGGAVGIGGGALGAPVGSGETADSLFFNDVQ